jgi:hypothetical protein
MEPRPIVFKEWRDTRTFSSLKSTHSNEKLIPASFAGKLLLGEFYMWSRMQNIPVHQKRLYK